MLDYARHHQQAEIVLRVESLFALADGNQARVELLHGNVAGIAHGPHGVQSRARFTALPLRASNRAACRWLASEVKVAARRRFASARCAADMPRWNSRELAVDEDRSWPKLSAPGCRGKLALAGSGIAPKVSFLATRCTHTPGHEPSPASRAAMAALG